ncbi:MAG: hypothetical protein R3E39_04130 [Anaerolineae bacterium]
MTDAAICDMQIANNYRDKGDFGRALTLYEKANAKRLERRVMWKMKPLRWVTRGRHFSTKGKFAAAYADLKGCLDLVASVSGGRHERDALLCEVHHALAQHLRRQRYGVAWDRAISAYEISLIHPTARAKGFANRTVAEVLTVVGAQPFDRRFVSDPDVYYQAALSAFQEVHSEVESARTLYLHALSLVQRGRKMAAARKLRHAMIIFTRLGMVHDAAKAARAQLDVM